MQGELIRRYEAERSALLLERTRALIAAGAAVYFPFWGVDWIAVPDQVTDFLLLRLSTGTLLLASYLATRASWAQRWALALSSGWLAAVIASVIVMTAWMGGF